jgi:Right handed beta helix region
MVPVKTFRVTILFVSLCFLAACGVTGPSLEAQAGQYIFVETTGKDSSSCGAQSSPCKTIGYALPKTQAGDTIQVGNGIFYERRLQLDNQGTASQPITIRAANQRKAVIDNGLQVTKWTLDSGAVYRGKPIFTPLTPDDKITNTQRVVVAGRPLIKVSSRAAVNEGSFYVASDGTLFVWAFGGANPGATQPGTGIPSTIVINQPLDDPKFGAIAPTPGIYVNGYGTGNSYYVLDGFVHRGGHSSVWAARWDGQKGKGLVLKNCEIAFNWQYALRLDNWQDVTMSGCDVHGNAQVHFLRDSKVVWPHSIIGWYSDKVRIVNSKIHDNHGEGVGPFTGSTNWQIVGNTVYDNFSINIYIDSGEDNHIVSRNLVYNTNNYPDDSDGIRIANEDADCYNNDSTPAISNIRVTNNVVLNTGGGIRFFPYAGSDFCPLGRSSLANSLIAHNTVVNSPSNNGLPAGIFVARGQNVSVINNIVYNGELALDGAQGSGMKAINNLLKTSADLSISGGNTATGTRYGNPQFVTGTGIVASNYKLNSNSPAVNTGLTFTSVKQDYLRVARPQGGAYDMGAFER